MALDTTPYKNSEAGLINLPPVTFTKPTPKPKTRIEDRIQKQLEWYDTMLNNPNLETEYLLMINRDYSNFLTRLK